MKSRFYKESNAVKRQYFLTTMIIFAAIFLVVYMLFLIFLTILQAHPYFSLAAVLITLIIDILTTNHIINTVWADRWKIRD
ncbi:MAG: hypothetical protein IJJ29_10910 [Solobacterium sp.]|nr:hypothetical protein [Solobacterium sp.]